MFYEHTLYRNYRRSCSNYCAKNVNYLSMTLYFINILILKNLNFNLRMPSTIRLKIHIKNCLEKCAMRKISLKYHTKLKNMITLKKHDNIILIL